MSCAYLFKKNIINYILLVCSRNEASFSCWTRNPSALSLLEKVQHTISKTNNKPPVTKLSLVSVYFLTLTLFPHSRDSENSLSPWVIF